MANQYFQFKQFRIEQGASAMKVGTDGVLLGSWSDCTAAKKILDIGTGTGLIALMLAQRGVAEIVAVEIEKSSYLQACQNIENSQWSERISVHHEDFLNPSMARKDYDLIVSNPPFFANAKVSMNASRTLARHDHSLPLSSLIERSVKLLSSKGKICVIVPASRKADLEAIASVCDMYPAKYLMVRPKPQRNIERILVELKRGSGKTEVGELLIETEKRGEYSREYKKLTETFYLNF